MFPRWSGPVSDGSGLDEAWFVDPALCTPTPTVQDTYRDPDGAAAALAVLAPGGDKVDLLLGMQAGRLSDTGLVDAIIATDRQLAALQAKQQEFLAQTVERDPDGEKYLREDVACAMHLAPGTTAQRLDIAVALMSRLWDTRELMEAGRLSYTHARILATAVEPLSDAVTAKVQARVLKRAEGQTPGEFRAAVKRAVARFDTRNQTERHAVAFADRKVVHYPEDDGMASIWLHLAADGAATVMTAINARACAGRGPGTEPADTRTADQRRADAAVEICLAALDNPNLPTAHGLRPAVNITIADTTLQGLDDQPAELDGYGPIPASMGRRIASAPGATIRHWIVDEHGRLLDRQPDIASTSTSGDATSDGIASTDKYEPTARITRQVLARDQHCVHPGCRRKAVACQLDHRIPWPEGPTDVTNIEPLCKRHHDLKHHSKWTMIKNPDGSYDWTSPTNHRYRYRPPELPTPTSQPEQPARSGRDPNDDPPPF